MSNSKLKFKEIDSGVAALKPQGDRGPLPAQESTFELPFKHPRELFLVETPPSDVRMRVLGHIDTQRQTLNIQGSEYTYSHEEAQEFKEEVDFKTLLNALYLNQIPISKGDLALLLRVVAAVEANPQISLKEAMNLRSTPHCT